MNNRTSSSELALELPSPDLERARQLIGLSLGVWICIGVLAALHGGGFA